MGDALGTPSADVFHVFRPRDPSELKFHPSYGAVDRRSLVVVRITLVRIHPIARKRALFAAIAEKFAVLGIRNDDLLIVLAENGWEDWYAGRVGDE